MVFTSLDSKGASSRTTCAFVPPMLKALNPAMRFFSPFGQATKFEEFALDGIQMNMWI